MRGHLGRPAILGVVPAAGMSRRMGAIKQTLPVGGCTMTARVARTMLDAQVSAVAVVTRSELVGLLALPEDDRVVIGINDDPATHMLDSVRIGLSSLGREHSFASAEGMDAGVLVIPGDMPSVSVAACQACIGAFGCDPTRIVIATSAGKRGHPILFPWELRSSLGGLKGRLSDLPLRFAKRVTEIELDDPGVLLDVDTRADYEELCK